MKVLDIIDLARDYLNEPLSAGRSVTFPDDSSSFWKDSTLLRYLNREQAKVANHIIDADENFFVTQTSIDIVAGQEEYSLPTDLIKVKRLEWLRDDADPVEIKPMSLNDKDKHRGSYVYDDIITGDPTEYAFVGGNILLRPIPAVGQASGLKLYYAPQIDDLVSQSESPVIPSQFHELLAVGVAKRAVMQQEGDPSHFVREYRELMADLKRFIENRTTQRSRTIKRKKVRW